MSSNPPSKSDSASPSALLDQAIEFVLLQLRQGTPTTEEELVRQFPTIEKELREVYSVLILADQLHSESDQATMPESLGSVRSIDGELLLGAFALQCGCLNPKQFLGAFEAWNLDRSASFRKILFDRQDIAEATRTLLKGLFEQQISPSDFVELSSIDGCTLAFSESPQPLSTHGHLELNDLANKDSSARYRFIRPLDRGGLGVVSVALDEDLNREVAIKEIRRDRYDNGYLLHKFLLEAQVTGGLEHPGIVPIYGIGRSADGRPYYAMRLIKGNNLRQHIKLFHESIAKGAQEFDGPQLRRLLQRFIDVCNAIEYAHARGILHRDIKPVNIMLGRYGETLVVDWGLAKAVGESLKVDSDYEISEATTNHEEQPLTPSGSDAGSETRLGSVLGTPAYASPEQLTGQVDRIGVTSDVYGLGATLYELLTGQAPVSGTLLEIVQIVNAGKIPSPRSVQPAVPKALQAICQKSMSLNPADRYGSAQLLRQDIEHWLDDAPVTAYSESLLLRCRRWIRKHPTAASTIGVTALLSVLGSGTITAVVTQKNHSLAQLNAKLDAKNVELGEANNELAESNRREIAAREVAQEQSELALSTLSAVVQDIQAGLKNVPRSSEIRRRLLATSLSRLDQVATRVAKNASADRSTMIALRDIAELIVQFGADDSTSIPGPKQPRVNSEESRSTTRIAQRALERAHEIALSRFESDPKDPQTLLDLVLLKESLGQNSMRIGESDKSIETARESLRLISELVDRSPQQNRFLSVQAKALHTLADALDFTGQYKDAKQYFERELEILRNLDSTEGDKGNYKSSLALTLEKLGKVELRLNNNDQADRLLEDSTLRLRTLLEDPRESNRFSRRLASVLWWHSECKMKLGKIDQAEALIAEASQRYQEASDQDPTDLTLRVFVSNVLEREGDILERASKLDLATNKLKQSLEIREQLLKGDPSNAFRARQISIIKNQLGSIELQRGNPDEALEYMLSSLAICEELLKNDPNSEIKQRDLKRTQEQIAKVYRQLGDFEKSLDILRRLSENHEQLSKANPDDKIKKRDWIEAIIGAATVYRESGQLNQAETVYLQALDLCQQLLANDSENGVYLRDKSIVLESLSVNSQLRNDPAKSLEYIEQCIQVRKAIADKTDKDVFAKMDLASAYHNGSKTLGILGRFDDSLEQGKQAIAIFEEVLQADDSDLSVLEYLASAQHLQAITYTMKEDYDQSLKFVRLSWQNYSKLVDRPKVPYAWLFNWAEAGKSAYQTEMTTDHPEEAKAIYKQLKKRLEELVEKKQSVKWATQQLEILETLVRMLEAPPNL